MLTSLDAAAYRNWWRASVDNFRFPDTKDLLDGLNLALGEVGLHGIETILARQHNVQTSTYPSEIVACCLQDGSTRKLLLKYGPSFCSTSYGHRGGISYEAEIYSDILAPLGMSTPKYYGTYVDQSAGVTCLAMEYVENNQRIMHTCEPIMKMRQAAQWIGNFHAKSEAQFASAKIPNIITYNTEYYEGWIARARENCAYLHVGYPWFLPLCERAGELLSHLLTCPLVIIHGEYYPKNILTNENGIVPIDWESTALAAGEIDLAMLTEGWLEEDLGDFMAVYQAARWPEGLAENFKQRLAAAQLYIHFRWLGDHLWLQKEPTLRFDHPWSQEEPPLRFDLMYRLARQLHLI